MRWAAAALAVAALVGGGVAAYLLRQPSRDIPANERFEVLEEAKARGIIDSYEPAGVGFGGFRYVVDDGEVVVRGQSHGPQPREIYVLWRYPSREARAKAEALEPILRRRMPSRGVVVAPT